MKALANLHESLEWLNLRLRKTFARLNADVNAEGDILMNLNNILSKFQSVSEQCLLYLHMEQRVRCFLYLGQIFRGARFDVKVCSFIQNYFLNFFEEFGGTRNRSRGGKVRNRISSH